MASSTAGSASPDRDIAQTVGWVRNAQRGSVADLAHDGLFNVVTSLLDRLHERRV
jgi:hypothetical protein